MERRTFVTFVLATGLITPFAAAQEHDHRPIAGPMANATVSFGSWRTDAPLDRFPNVSDRTRNAHQLIPHEATVKSAAR